MPLITFFDTHRCLQSHLRLRFLEDNRAREQDNTLPIKPNHPTSDYIWGNHFVDYLSFEKPSGLLFALKRILSRGKSRLAPSPSLPSPLTLAFSDMLLSLPGAGFPSPLCSLVSSFRSQQASCAPYQTSCLCFLPALKTVVIFL